MKAAIFLLSALVLLLAGIILWPRPTGDYRLVSVQYDTLVGESLRVILRYDAITGRSWLMLPVPEYGTNAARFVWWPIIEGESGQRPLVPNFPKP